MLTGWPFRLGFLFTKVVLLAPIVFLIRSTMARRLYFTGAEYSIDRVFLIVADFLYFYALDFEDALISVASMLRRVV